MSATENFTRISLSFLSLVVWASLVNFKQGISLVIWVFPWVFPGFEGVVDREGKSLGNLGVFLDKTERPRTGRTGRRQKQREKNGKFHTHFTLLEGF